MLRNNGTFSTDRPYAYGYAKHKSTAHALLLNVTMATRLTQSKQNYLRIYYDLKNAFFCGDHDNIHAANKKHSKKHDLHLLDARCKEAML